MKNNIKEIKRGDVFFANLDGAKGSEQGGERPVIIVQNNIGNKYSPTVQIVCVTSKLHKAKLPTHVELPSTKTPFKFDSVALVEQTRTIDKSRLGEFVGKLDNEFMREIGKALIISFNLQEDVA